MTSLDSPSAVVKEENVPIVESAESMTVCTHPERALGIGSNTSNQVVGHTEVAAKPFEQSIAKDGDSTRVRSDPHIAIAILKEREYRFL